MFYGISGEQELIAKTSFNWASVYKMLPSCPSCTFKNMGLSRDSPITQCLVYTGVVYQLQNIFCLDADLCATITSVSNTHWSSRAALIDMYSFPAHGVCFKLVADMSALDVVHLKFSVWVHFLR